MENSVSNRFKLFTFSYSKKDNMDHRHHGQSQPLHLSSLPAATAAHIQHSSSHLNQVSQPQPIFISAPENRQIHSDLIHRRRIATTRRNFALGKLLCLFLPTHLVIKLFNFYSFMKTICVAIGDINFKSMFGHQPHRITHIRIIINSRLVVIST